LVTSVDVRTNLQNDDAIQKPISFQKTLSSSESVETSSSLQGSANERIVRIFEAMLSGIQLRLLTKDGRIPKKCCYVHNSNSPDNSHLHFIDDFGDKFTLPLRDIRLSSCAPKSYFETYQEFSLSRCLSIKTFSTSIDVEYASECLKEDFRVCITFIKSRISKYVDHECETKDFKMVLHELDILLAHTSPSVQKSHRVFEPTFDRIDFFVFIIEKFLVSITIYLFLLYLNLR
jgi:hypothetical protein